MRTILVTLAILAGIVLGGVVGGYRVQGQVPSSIEYKVETVGFKADEIQKVLNERATEGWRLHSQVLFDGPSLLYTMLIFTRNAEAPQQKR